MAMAGVLFFVSAYSTMQYIILNYFTAVILENFETTDDEKTAVQMAAFRSLFKFPSRALVLIQLVSLHYMDCAIQSAGIEYLEEPTSAATRRSAQVELCRSERCCPQWHRKTESLIADITNRKNEGEKPEKLGVEGAEEAEAEMVQDIAAIGLALMSSSVTDE